MIQIYSHLPTVFFFAFKDVIDGATCNVLFVNASDIESMILSSGEKLP